MSPWRGAALCIFAATTATAETGLHGRDVLFRVEAWFDRTTPEFITRDYIATVTHGPEFAVAAESLNGMIAVPVKVDISEDRIDLSYIQTPPGQFSTLDFNGYVLTFLTDCVLFTAAAIDSSVTTLPITDAHLIVEPRALLINVSGMTRDRQSHIGITLDVQECPIG